MVEFASEEGIKLLTSIPYYARSKEKVEVTKIIIIGLINKHVGQKPKNWHKTLDQRLWACRMSPKEEINTTPFQITFGNGVVFPAEIYM